MASMSPSVNRSVANPARTLPHVGTLDRCMSSDRLGLRGLKICQNKASINQSIDIRVSKTTK
jgi:hypothetical protein